MYEECCKSSRTFLERQVFEVMKTEKERLKAVEDIIHNAGGFGMTRPLKQGTLKNRKIGESCTGYFFQIDNLSYRGVWLSTIESLCVWVDDEEIPEESLSVELKGVRYPITSLGQQNETFWGATDKFFVHVNKVKGLSKGEHKVKIKMMRRSDFGHSFGNGTEGYEKAFEFCNPEKICDEMICSL